MRVGLFVTCLTDTYFPATGRAAVEVLERVGCEVEFPLEQTCCGQMHANSGYSAQADRLMRRFLATFDSAELDAIVCPSGSCAAMLHEQYPRLARRSGDAALIASAEAMRPRVHEFSQFLVGRLGMEDVGASFPHRVAYHPSCHSLRSLRVGDAPERLLRRVEGLELVELENRDVCCGFGGTFAIKNAETSTAMLIDKVAALERSGAEVCAALDNSCLLQIGGGLGRAGAAVRPMHLAEILAARG